MLENLIRDMLAELNEAPAVYRPTNIWSSLAPLHMELLDHYGIENFKKTVNRHYGQDCVVIPENDLIQNLARHLGTGTPQHRPHIILDQELRIFDTEEHARIYATYLGLLWDACARMDPGNIRDTVFEPELGAPVYVNYQGRPITQDMAKSVIDYITITGSFPGMEAGRKVVAEIGPGYGRLAHVFAQLTDCRWMFFDIPPTLAVAQYYWLLAISSG